MKNATDNTHMYYNTSESSLWSACACTLNFKEVLKENLKILKSETEIMWQTLWIVVNYFCPDYTEHTLVTKQLS